MLDCTVNTSRPRSLHVDHIIEVSDGGLFWDPANLRTLCWLHHGAKTRLVMANRSGTVGGRAADEGFPGPSRDW